MHYRKLLKKATAIAVAAAMLAVSAVPAFADDINPGQETTGSYTYSAPTSPMDVNSNIITATAHRAAAPILGIMGVNAVCGFGMINGGAPSSLEDAETRVALGIWGTNINSKPDPYYWNYFYNFYASKNGLEESEDALVNLNVAASPMQADQTLLEEYGNISVSLSKRPEIVVGCSSSGRGTDTNGYDTQLDTIRSFAKDSPYYQEGDESYYPELVSYQTTTIKEMIQSVHALADAITNVQKKDSTKKTRYGNVQKIASDYEDYVYGIIAYVREELAAKGMSQKKIAVVTSIDGNGQYTIADNYSQAATSLVRAYEYAMTVTTNLCDDYGTTVTTEQLLKADAIITFNNSNITEEALVNSFNGAEYNGIIISNTPSAMYGVTMNSVENAMGYAYTIGSLYSDVLDIDPVDLCAYFYEYFCHVSDKDGLNKVITTNFADTNLPDGVTGTLSSDYSASKIQSQLRKGKSYYNTYASEFTDDECVKIGIDGWDTTSNSSVGSGGTTSGFYGVTISAAEGGTVTSNLTNTKEGSTVILTATPDSGYALSGITVKNAAGEEIALKENADGTYSFTMPAQAVTVAATFANANALKMAFTDVADGAWYYDAVKYVYENGIMSGTSDTIFNPNGKLTRAMLAQILYNHAGKPEAAASKYSDVAAGTWYSAAVGWAAEKGIVTGYSDGTFKPNDSVTREQLAAMLYRYAGSPAATGSLDSFTDASSASVYAQDALKWAVSSGIISGNGSATTLDPKGTASRAQVAVMLMRYLESK